MSNEQVKELKHSIDEKLNALAKDLEQGHTESFKEYLKFTANFHRYSWCNQFLIMHQMPNASLVAGFRTWQKQNRFVKKGEKAIRILAPMFFKEKIETPKGEETQERVWFKDVCVFDVSQTYGEEIPQWKECQGTIPPETYQKLNDFARSKNIDVSFDHCAGALGLSKGGRIALDLSIVEDTAKCFAVLAHEIAHELLHWQGEKKSFEYTKEQKEMEAESVAYVIASHFGIDAMSKDYLLSYKVTPAMLKSSLERIQKLSSEILSFLNDEQTQQRKAA